MTLPCVPRRHAIAALVAFAAVGPAAAQTTSTGSGQAYPDKPIRLVVGFAPGGFTDVLARVTGQKLTERMGQPVIVDNKPGAAGTLGADIVAKAKPDGYTLLLAHSNSNSVAPGLYPKLPYDVPTLAEAGVPNAEMLQWFAVMGPAKLPTEITRKLNTEIAAILKMPDVVEKIASQGGEIIGGTPEEFAAFLPGDSAGWVRLVKEANVKAD